MRSLLGPILFVMLCLADLNAQAWWFTADTATEAETSFQFYVTWEAPEAPDEALAKELIEEQLLHLFGSLTEHEFPGVPKGNHRISDVRVESTGLNQYRIHYQYQGTLLVTEGPIDTYQVALPYNPRKIYQQSAVESVDEKGNKKTTYPCTDDYYDTEDDFWYFWYPNWEGCPLVSGTHYEWVSAKIERIPNSKETYPDYPRLAMNGEIKVSVLFGKDEAESPRNPMRSKDESAENFRTIRKNLLDLGFIEEKWNRRKVKDVVPVKMGGKAHVPFVAEYFREGARADMRVLLFYGETGIDEKSGAFHYFLKDALENSSVMIYNGHSGLGGNLDIEDIEDSQGFTIQPNPSRYQIYFYDSCSSYPYYNSMYFGRKQTEWDPRGTYNLDILTNGLWTYFSTEKNTSWVLVDAVSEWARGGFVVSYQQMAKAIESNSLFGVNGDEDNPVEPPK